MVLASSWQHCQAALLGALLILVQCCCLLTAVGRLCNGSAVGVNANLVV